MEAEFYMTILTCLILGSLEGFQIVHVRKQQCLSINQMVIMSSCNGTSHNQQWLSTENGKFLHIKSGLCLSISNSSGGPFRPAVATLCAQAPRWTCHAQGGFLEVENTSLFLKKQSRKVVVRKISKYLDSWMKLAINKEGRLVNESLCLKQGTTVLQDAVRQVTNSDSHSALFVSTSFDKLVKAVTVHPQHSSGLGTEVSVRITRNSAAPQVPTTSNTISYSPGHISKITETFLGSTAETLGSTAEPYSQNSSKRDLPSLHTAGTTDTSWCPSTTPPFSSTTAEVKGEGMIGL